MNASKKKAAYRDSFLPLKIIIGVVMTFVLPLLFPY